MDVYSKLQAKLAEIADIKAAVALMLWDQEVMMSPGSAPARGRQVATLNSLIHEKFLNEAGHLVAESEKEDDGTDKSKTLSLKQLRVELDQRLKLPAEHIHASSMATNRAFTAWRKAKPASDFSLFSSALEDLVQLKRQEAGFLAVSDEPYDALLDSFEPGMRAPHLHKLFDNIKQPLGELLSEIRQRPQIDDSFLRTNIPAAQQLEWSHRILEKMGYDFQYGRQDLSSHPFMISMGPRDVRVTTMVDENDVGFSMYSSIHEGGHALYELGVPDQFPGMPAGDVCTLSIHESQSRLWENNVCRSLPFLDSQFQDFSQLFPDKLAGKSSMDVFKAFNKVEPSLVRIAADELTYHFHIILRFELEEALINGKIEVKDLPAAWNEKVKNYLGLDVPNDAQGVLQDIHWSHGSFGYFPTYSLGSLYAAQFLNAAERAVPDLNAQFAKGEFGSLRSWLSENIWAHGHLYDAEDLCKIATGEPLNVNYFVSYARKKFGVAYGINS